MTEELTLDHVLPRSRGGKTTWDNIVTCCVSCNAEKAARTPEEAGMHLRSAPRKPAYLPAVVVRMDRRGIPRAWIPYWTGALEP